MIVCPKCGTVLPDGSVFCLNCGSPIENIQVPIQKKSNKKTIGIIAALLAVLVGTIITVVIIINKDDKAASSSSSKNTEKDDEKESKSKKLSDFALYIKDGDLVYSDLKKDGKKQTIAYVEKKNVYSSMFFLTRSGKLFYPGEVTSNSFEVYCRDIYDSKDKGEMAASSVKSYSVDDGGTYLTYKSTEDTLFQLNLEDSEVSKISNYVSKYYVSEDGRRILYKKENSLFYWERGGKDIEKISGNASDMIYVDKNCKIAYFLEDRDFYKYEAGREKELIASEISNVTANDTGKLYYSKKDYLEVTEEERDNYMGYEIEDKWEEEDDDEYVYYISLNRLYYYDGKRSEKISDHVRGGFRGSSNSPAIIYSEEYYDDDTIKYFLALEDKTQQLSSDYEYCKYQFSPDGKALYYILYDSGDDAEDGWDLFRIEINGNNIGKAEKYDSGVYSFVVYDKNTVLYSKDFYEKYNSFELYLNKKKVASDVNNYRYDLDSGRLYYLTDLERSENIGFLYEYNNGKNIKIAEDVFGEYFITANGNLFYLQGYDYDDADLYYYNGKSEKIDNEVSQIIIPMMKEG